MMRTADGPLADVRKSRRRGYFATRGEFDPGGWGSRSRWSRNGSPFRSGAGPPPRMNGKLAAVGRAVNDTAAAMPRAAASA
ncbi:MAG TPA: hypothetical protein VLD36_13480 [Burkholderiales bacterium]|nr:hypothetical protein [Burkholderiales bacterium]